MKFFICKKNNIGIENVVKKVQSELEKMGFEYTDSKPDIVIIGDSEITITVGSKYEDQGAKANDNVKTRSNEVSRLDWSHL